MKKLITTVVLCAGFAVPAVAQHHHGHWHHRSDHNPWIWVAPAVIGGVIGYGISRNQTPVVQQPVIIQPYPAPIYGVTPNCSLWTEIQNSDGTITRTRTCSQ